MAARSVIGTTVESDHLVGLRGEGRAAADRREPGLNLELVHAWVDEELALLVDAERIDLLPVDEHRPNALRQLVVSDTPPYPDPR